MHTLLEEKIEQEACVVSISLTEKVTLEYISRIRGLPGWLRLQIPRAGAWVQSPVWEVDPTCHMQIKGPACHN